MAPVIIDTIPCYAPDKAFDNTGYHPEALQVLSNLERNNFWYISRNTVLKIIFRRFLNNNPSETMEVGCGNGVVLHALTELKNLRLTGADIYLSGVKFAKSQVPGVNFIQMDAENIPFDNSFDAIGCFDVLEHIDNDVAVISQLRKALKNKGYLFITVPLHPWLWSEIDEIDRHKRRYTKSEIIKKVENAGFRIRHTNCFACAVFPLVVISRFMRKKDQKHSQITNEQVSYPEIEISRFTNAILRAIMRIDEMLYKFNLKLPFGSSIVLVATKED